MLNETTQFFLNTQEYARDAEGFFYMGVGLSVWSIYLCRNFYNGVRIKNWYRDLLGIFVLILCTSSVFWGSMHFTELVRLGSGNPPLPFIKINSLGIELPLKHNYVIWNNIEGIRFISKRGGKSSHSAKIIISCKNGATVCIDEKFTVHLQYIAMTMNNYLEAYRKAHK